MKKDAQTYIENKLEEFYSKFHGIKVRYEYDVQMKLHLVEILPQSVYDENQAYVLAEIKMEEEFENCFGHEEEILFVSEDSLNKIENPSFQLGYNSIDLEINIEDLFENINIVLSSINTELEGKVESFTSDNNSYALAA